MNMATKKDIFNRYKKEYWKASKERKSEIIGHVKDVTQMHRKAVIRRFRVLQTRTLNTGKGRGRSVYYTKDVDAALFDIWEAANRPCGELLFPLIDEYASILIRDNMWSHGDLATGKLRAMGKRTVRRRIEEFQQKYDRDRSGVSATKPSHLKSIIPIFKGPWGKLSVGSGQIDTVAHCGNSLQGDFIYTVNYTDAPTYWIIPRAQWNKGEEATRASLEKIRQKFPTTLVFLHPDTGTEFINWTLKGWTDECGISLSRSEPGKKNDNMYVEERNGHVVRKYLGYTRLDCRELVPLLNEFYEVLALYLNHFQAVRRTTAKEKVGSKHRRQYEKVGKTPYQRMLEREDVPEEVKEWLRREHEQLNPLILKQKLDKLLIKIMKQQRDCGSRGLS